ncbi:hypothetical protein THAOC_07633 [Thalassiosira oceanica]|uniref:Uncharacterized protein n=1 Tax=Thalassiosira oceanica TaxID=159749 RepID=K0TJZ4_THAOC|nr:hypothetical protein THAOC_07633 [Thalassiosira oceanica]|eukprot:EJK70967.1 hypothetical protein THAOC_07633 [Thalassiosira oceanica]
MTLSLYPILRLFENPYQPLLLASRLRYMIVVEGYLGRGRNHDTFDSRVRIGEAELNPTIVEQVELEISSPTQALPMLLFVTVFATCVLPHDRKPRRHPSLSYISHELKCRPRGRQVVEEDSTRPSVFRPCWKIEVIITALKRREGSDEKNEIGSHWNPFPFPFLLPPSFERAKDYIRFLEGKISQPFPSGERETRLHLRHSDSKGSSPSPRQTKHLIGTHP